RSSPRVQELVDVDAYEIEPGSKEQRIRYQRNTELKKLNCCFDSGINSRKLVFDKEWRGYL
ncbi:unnamed protein product, partial [Allacma fusca]